MLDAIFIIVPHIVLPALVWINLWIGVLNHYKKEKDA